MIVHEDLTLHKKCTQNITICMPGRVVGYYWTAIVFYTVCKIQLSTRIQRAVIDVCVLLQCLVAVSELTRQASTPVFYDLFCILSLVPVDIRDRPISLHEVGGKYTDTHNQTILAIIILTILSYTRIDNSHIVIIVVYM